MSSADARGGAPAERLRLVRPLGARAVPTWAALDAPAGEKPRVVVVERVTRGGDHGDQEIADWVRDARRVATLEHPNVGRVRDVIIAGDEVTVVSEFVDGVRWSELLATEPRPGLEAALRVLVDVLTGLSALHNLRDAKREPLKLVHGELTPECIVVGTDGGARVVGPARVRSAAPTRGRSGSSYLAPEILLADESADARADVYGAGVLLWELLSGQRLFADAQPSAIVTQLLSGRVPPATVPPGHAWAEPLVGLAARALSADPAKRFASAAGMAAEIRRVAGPKLAPQAAIAAHIRGVFGDRIRARREELERGEARPAPLETADAELPSEDIRISVAPTPLPPPPTATTKPPPPVAPPPVPKRGGQAPAKVTVPTPFVAIEIPQAARVPTDLQPGVGEIPAPVVAAATRSQSPAPAVPPVVVTPPEVPAAAPRKRSKAAALAMVLAPVALVAVALVWWLASRPSEDVRHAAPAASATATVAAAPHPPAPMPPATASAASSASTASAPSTAAAPAETAAPEPETTPSQTAPAPAASQPAAVRPPPRPKYEPEGI